jgi:hypothetical protein
MEQRLKVGFEDMVSDFRTAQYLGYVWLDAVSEFSRLALSRESDRLPALSGLARKLSPPVWGHTSPEYGS